MNIKLFIKDCIPPVFLRILRQYFRKNVYWDGNYSTWSEAKVSSSGYDSDKVLERVRESLLAVKNGEALYERDGVLYDSVQYSWPLLTGLILAAQQFSGKFSIIDFGGSLGSTYYQNKKFLDQLRLNKWNIVEQHNFVEVGKRDFQDDTLKFHHNMSECWSEDCGALVFSSVLQYIESPYLIVENALDFNFRFILIDRTPFTKLAEDRLTVQNVPSHIYEASYPCWFFNENKFLSYFESKGYELFAEFDDEVTDKNSEVYFKGFILKNVRN